MPPFFATGVVQPSRKHSPIAQYFPHTPELLLWWGSLGAADRVLYHRRVCALAYWLCRHPLHSFFSFFPPHLAKKKSHVLFPRQEHTHTSAWAGAECTHTHFYGNSFACPRTSTRSPIESSAIPLGYARAKIGVVPCQLAGSGHQAYGDTALSRRSAGGTL